MDFLFVIHPQAMGYRFVVDSLTSVHVYHLFFYFCNPNELLIQIFNILLRFLSVSF